MAFFLESCKHLLPTGLSKKGGCVDLYRSTRQIKSCGRHCPLPSQYASLLSSHCAQLKTALQTPLQLGVGGGGTRPFFNIEM